jgi:hypothetical protein
MWYKLTPRIGVLVKVIVKQLVRTFPAFRGTANVITAFTKASYLSRCWARGIQSASYNPFLFKIGFNTNLPSTPRSYRWSFSFRFSHQNCYEFLFCSVRATNPSVSFSFVLLPLHCVVRNEFGASVFVRVLYSKRDVLYNFFNFLSCYMKDQVV